jgi:hypothetical protein
MGEPIFKGYIALEDSCQSNVVNIDKMVIWCPQQHEIKDPQLSFPDQTPMLQISAFVTLEKRFATQVEPATSRL